MPARWSALAERVLARAGVARRSWCSNAGGFLLRPLEQTTPAEFDAPARHQPAGAVPRRAGLSARHASRRRRRLRQHRQRRRPRRLPRERRLRREQVRAPRAARDARGGVPRHRRAADAGLSRADRHRPSGTRSTPERRARLPSRVPRCCGPRTWPRRCSSSLRARRTSTSTGSRLRPDPADQPPSRTRRPRCIRSFARRHAGRATRRLGAAAPRPASPHARQRRLGRARARGGARSRRVPSGSAPTARASTACRAAPPPGSASGATRPPRRISWDFVHAFAFGPRGQIWYGTVGNGWGLSTDGGRTWKNWTYDQLGPEWQYVAAAGIATRGDTTVIATADGLQITTDDGAHWTAIGDSVGPLARGPADTALPLLANEYVRRLASDRDGAGSCPRSAASSGCAIHRRRWVAEPVDGGRLSAAPRLSGRSGGRVYRGTPLRPPAGGEYREPCLRRNGAEGRRRPRSRSPLWLERPIARDGQQLHRPDLPLRLDHGRELPAAPGRRVQQSRRHAGARRGSTAPWCTPAAPRQGR